MFCVCLLCCLHHVKGDIRKGQKKFQDVGGAGYIDLGEIAIVKPQYGETAVLGKLSPNI